ncbi:MAG: DUF4231 domain-containing protein [Bernardetiaceae bacterium]
MSDSPYFDDPAEDEDKNLSEEEKEAKKARFDPDYRPIVEEKFVRTPYRGDGANVEPLARTMPFIEDGEYMVGRVDDQINYFSNKSSRSQKIYKRFKKQEFWISAFIPFVITLSGFGFVDAIPPVPGTKLTVAVVLQITAALGGVYLAYLSKYEDLEKHFNIWKEYRATCEELLHEKYLYLAKAEPYDESDAYPLFVMRVESILHKETQRWMQIQRKEDTKKKSSDTNESKE